MSDPARRRAGVRVIVGVALTFGAYFTTVMAALAAIHYRRLTTSGGVRLKFTDPFHRDLVIFAVAGGVIVVVGMALWLPVAARRRGIRPVWLVFGVLLAVPAAIPAVLVAEYATRTVDAVAPAPAPDLAPLSSVLPPTSVQPCVLTPGNGCELPVYELRGTRWSDTWPVWANVAFAVGLAVPFVLLGWAYVWVVRRRSSAPVADR